MQHPEPVPQQPMKWPQKWPHAPLLPWLGPILQQIVGVGLALAVTAGVGVVLAWWALGLVMCMASGTCGDSGTHWSP